MYKQMYITTRANVLSVEDGSVQPERRRWTSRFRCRISRAVWSSLLLREACQVAVERRRVKEGMVRYITYANGKGCSIDCEGARRKGMKEGENE